MSALAEMIKKKMEIDDLKISQAAKAAGISYPSFKKLLDDRGGNRAPQKRVIASLARWLGQDEHFLLMIAKGKASPGAAKPIEPDSASGFAATGNPGPAPVLPGGGGRAIEASQLDLVRACDGELAVEGVDGDRRIVLSGAAAIRAFLEGRL